MESRHNDFEQAREMIDAELQRIASGANIHRVNNLRGAFRLMLDNLRMDQDEEITNLKERVSRMIESTGKCLIEIGKIVEDGVISPAERTGLLAMLGAVVDSVEGIVDVVRIHEPVKVK